MFHFQSEESFLRFGNRKSPGPAAGTEAGGQERAGQGRLHTPESPASSASSAPVSAVPRLPSISAAAGDRSPPSPGGLRRLQQHLASVQAAS